MKCLLLLLLPLLLIGCGDIEEQPDYPFHFEETMDIAPSAPSRVGENYVKVQAFYVEPRSQINPPTEREYNQSARKIRNLLSRSRRFYREQMEEHGHGRKTFELVKENGRVKINRLTLDHTERSYVSGNRDFIEEIREIAANHRDSISIFFMSIDIPNACGLGSSHETSYAYIDGDCWNWQTVSHELGHTFDLHHDFRLGRRSNRIMAYGNNRDRLSEGAAQWLNAHPAFNRSAFFEDNFGYLIDILRKNPPKIEFMSYNYDQDVSDPINYTVAQLLDIDGAYPELLSFTNLVKAKRTERDPREILYTIRFNRIPNPVPKKIEIKVASNRNPMVRTYTKF